MSVVIVDKGWTKILEAARELAAAKPYVAVGLIGSGASQSHGEGLTNVDIGTVHEYGTSRIPQRSFIASTIDSHSILYAKELARVFRASVAAGVFSSPKVGLTRLGMRVVGDIQQQIADGIPPPNAPATVERKGSSKPLIDSGQMRQAINFEVRS